MTDAHPPHHPIKTALFIDFDNILLGLRNYSKEAALQFAREPHRWLAWIERGMPNSEENGATGMLLPRSVLLRHCYANPLTIDKFRSYFIRSAFSVIDCPTITGEPNKNSADIRMVMDVIDALEHKTRFDEFVLFSGDSDFMPLLLRLRAHDRRTAIVTVGPTARAYKAATDRVIEVDTFVEDALGTGQGIEAVLAEKVSPGAKAPARSADASKSLLQEIAARLVSAVSMQGEVTREQVTSIYLQFDEFRRSSSWLGFMNKRRLTEELVSLRPELAIYNGEDWKVVRRAVAPAAHAPGEQPMKPAAPAEEGARLPAFSQEEMRTRIFNLANQMVMESSEPVLMVSVADEARSIFGNLVDETHWAGAGTFRNLLGSCPNPVFKIAFTSKIPGILFDPARHEPPEDEMQVKALEGLPQDLADFIRRVSQVTGTPRLLPEDYAFIFRAISSQLDTQNYNPNQISKSVRDLAVERGASISRKNIGFILVGIGYGGHEFGESSEDDSPQALAKAFHRNTMYLCRGAQWELSGDERRLLDEWILGADELENDEEMQVQEGASVEETFLSGANGGQAVQGEDRTAVEN